MKTKRIYITIRIDYDPEVFPEGDMQWAAEKISEANELYDIGYDFDSFDTESDVSYHDINTTEVS